MRKRNGFTAIEVVICMLLFSLVAKCAASGYMMFYKTELSLKKTEINCSDFNSAMYFLLTDIRSAEKVNADVNKLIITLDNRVNVYEFENGQLYRNGAGLLQTKSCTFFISENITIIELELDNSQKVRLKVR